ncbi:hypothetical protein JL09_g6838 [Pichia kudriavzevii]|uniref:Uncharacterized protein n=1 Tax=Pichia kudriavzevii TaxID=4909 RepID=A0A099NJ03_PICKU|nr:hypothetical protein JL09_g6838 [Pichia kudriavzevii]
MDRNERHDIQSESVLCERKGT